MTGALLEPGAHRARSVVDEGALVAALLRVEVAWVAALGTVGAAEPAQVDAVRAAADSVRPDADRLAELAAEAEATGSPVVPVLRMLRAAVADDATAALVHRGLTSQDVLDTALMLLAREALATVATDLDATGAALAALADTHRGTVMAGRTLTQWAVPTTFGLKAAQWLAQLLDARDAVATAAAGLPVQCGGAAGTLSLAGELVTDPLAVATAFAEDLGLRRPGVPWHTNRSAVTAVGDALQQVCDVGGKLATDVLLLARPEVGELREGGAAGRGGSSTMPHKQNPVLSVLVRAAALQAPLAGAQLHLSSALAADERPDGAWHAEWPAFRRLMGLAVTSASQTRDLVDGLEVDTTRMAQRADEAAASLLAERDGSADAVPHGARPADYLGSATAFVDSVLSRQRSGRATDA